MKTYYLMTLGCPKNEVDSEFLMRDLLSLGMMQSLEASEADILIVNTCGFLESAIEEAQEAVTFLAEKKTARQKLYVIGCAVKRRQQAFTDPKFRVDELFATWQETAEYLTLDSHATDRLQLPTRLDTGLPYAYVKIADGCDENCSFCTIPSIKGGFRSHAPEQILAEIKSLSSQGVSEVILIAQNTTAYGLDLKKAGGKGAYTDLAGLLELICREVPELPWIRIMYAYPDYISSRLIKVMAAQDQVCKYLDLPMQHASARILKAMKRPSSISKHRQLIDRLRHAMPDIALRTTFIVGFPGETQDDFKQLRVFIREMRFDHVGAFQYSAEEGTPAARLPRQVRADTKLKRYDEIMGLQQSISSEKKGALVGKVLDVIVENRLDNREQYVLLGRSEKDAPQIDGLVYLKGEARIGEIVPARVLKSSEYDLWAEII